MTLTPSDKEVIVKTVCNHIIREAQLAVGQTVAPVPHAEVTVTLINDMYDQLQTVAETNRQYAEAHHYSFWGYLKIQLKTSVKERIEHAKEWISDDELLTFANEHVKDIKDLYSIA